MLKVQALILSWYSPETWNHLHTISQNRAFSGATFRQNSCVHSYSKKVLHAVYIFTPFKKYSKKELQKVEFWKRLFKVSWRQCCLQKNGLDEWLIKRRINMKLIIFPFSGGSILGRTCWFCWLCLNMLRARWCCSKNSSEAERSEFLLEDN